MEPLCQLLGITVNELLAGESIPILELMRSIDMSRLELIRQLEFEQLRMRLYKLYDIEIETMEPTENGACKFISNKQGKLLSTDKNGRRFTVQHFYEGTTYAYNEAPCKLQNESAVLLAKIHEAMKEIESIPVGIGADFFRYRKPEHMKASYSFQEQIYLFGAGKPVIKAACLV